MERVYRVVTPFGLGVAKQVESDSVAEVFFGAHAVDSFLHLAVTTLATFHSVGSRRQELVVEKGEGFFQVRAEEFLQAMAQLWEAAHSSAELGQLLKGALTAATTVKEAIDLFHDLSERLQVLVPST